ncbi:hypothetical protein BGZ73_004852 [Actinomortierella ambigua]|nr:hypothetical protein BGZ73_004852 [Actinomortierella ambigua]
MSPDYQWDYVDPGEQNTLHEDLSNPISELEFRATFLESMDSSAEIVSKLESEATPCTIDLTPINEIVGKIAVALKDTSEYNDFYIPIIAQTQAISKSLSSSASVENLANALASLQTFSRLLLYVKGTKVVGPLLSEAATSVKENLECLIKYNMGVFPTISDTAAGDRSVDAATLSFQPEKCHQIADLYRSMVEVAIKKATSVSEGTSKEMKRSTAGVRAVLKIMSKSSIAPNNADLLETRPIFVADVMEQFRQNYVQKADNDDQKLFGNTGLPLVIGASNALEACLRIAKDPVAAIDDLNEELELDEFEDDDLGSQEKIQGQLGAPTSTQ